MAPEETRTPSSKLTLSVNVETPETTSIPSPNVAKPTKPDTDWKVAIPVTLRLVNVLGAAEIAASIVAVVVVSKDAIFWSWNASLKTCVAPIEIAFAVIIPATLIPSGPINESPLYKLPPI